MKLHLLGRDECEAYLGFSYATASEVPFEQLQRAARELCALREFRDAYEKLQATFAESRVKPWAS